MLCLAGAFANQDCAHRLVCPLSAQVTEDLGGLLRDRDLDLDLDLPGAEVPK